MENPQFKRIRILSFQNAYNYGAVLQAYGLQQTIRSLGYNDVKFINYNPKYLSKRYSPFAKEYIIPHKTLKGIISWFIQYPFFFISRCLRNARIRWSIKELIEQTNELVLDENSLRTIEADVLICGSDQIWNTALTGDFDNVFFGKGSYKHIGYSASYAASTELAALKGDEVKKLSLMLDSFRFISVREIQVKDLLQPFVSKEIHVCVDPSLLCGEKAYNSIVSPRLESRDYILVYAYDYKDPVIKEMIESIPDFHKYTIHVILLGTKNIKNFFNARIHASITVQDFLSYIKYASYIVTNSFHGLAFSLLFEKNFNVAFCEGKQIRCLSLLQQLGLEDRMVHNGKKANWSDIDYAKTNSRMDIVRKGSCDYLNKILEG